MFDLGQATRLAAIDRRLATIERQTRLILDALGIADEPPTYPAVAAALQQGRKIDAIQAYRAETDAGLREAKKAVEEIQRELGY